MDIYEIRKANLKLLIGSRKKGACATKWDMSPAHLSQILSDKTDKNLGDEVARRIEDKEGLARGWLDSIKGATHTKDSTSAPFGGTLESNVVAAFQPDRYRRYPVISEVQAGEWSDIVDQFSPGDADEWQESPKDAGSHGFWLRITNDSMTSPSGKSFPEGMLVLVNPDAEVMPGNYVVAKLIDSDKATFKQYVEDASGKYLKPLNPSYRMIPINGNCQFVGKVVEAKWADL